jgi:tetratricopeptide (TPR) repeat protein
MMNMLALTKWDAISGCEIRSARIALLLMLAWVILLSTGRYGLSQFASLPQADSPKEFDDYLDVLTKSTPVDVISAAKQFERNWPESQLLGPVCQMELETYRSLNDPTDAIEAGQKALKFAPGNLAVTADLASIIADVATDPQRLDQAEQYAGKTLVALKTFTVPKWISPDKWEKIEGYLKSEAHAALGLVAYKRGGIAQGIREFETAIDLAPVPEPTEYYRLGRLYQAKGDKAAAIQKFRQAAAMNDPAIRQLAQKELMALDH